MTNVWYLSIYGLLNVCIMNSFPAFLFEMEFCIHLNLFFQFGKYISTRRLGLFVLLLFGITGGTVCSWEATDAWTEEEKSATCKKNPHRQKIKRKKPPHAAHALLIDGWSHCAETPQRRALSNKDGDEMKKGIKKRK